MNIILKILLWPGAFLTGFFPKLGEEERRLIYHMTNYIVWLSILVAGVIWYVITYPPI